MKVKIKHHLSYLPKKLAKNISRGLVRGDIISHGKGFFVFGSRALTERDAYERYLDGRHR